MACWLLTAIVSGAAVLWLWSTLAAIINFVFRYPAFDQYRLYPNYLLLPFPQNISQSENGHRPIVPNLLRLADLYGFAASQQLQIVVSIGAALLSLALIVRVVTRERQVPPLARAAACLFAVLTLFWLGNARTLMHGFEQAHVYLTVLACVLALLAVQRARTDDSYLWPLLAGGACLAATFSYGAGLASFAAVLLVSLVFGLRARYLLTFGALFAAAMLVYAFALPGNGYVRESLAFDPVGIAATMAQWLSSPWIRGWLGAGFPQFDAALYSGMTTSRYAHLLTTAATWLATPFGDDGAARQGVLVGAIGLLAYLAALVHACRHRASSTRLHFLGLGLASFIVASAGIVAIARAKYFVLYPEQIFADRYSPWPCLFWLGLALYAIAGSRRLAGAALAAAVAVATALVLLPTHRTQAIWSSIVYRKMQQSAVAAQLGIWDPKYNFDVASASREDTMGTLDLWRDNRLSMFAEPGFALVEGGWHMPAAVPPSLPDAEAHVIHAFDEANHHRRVAEFEGLLPRGVHLPRDPLLVVVDDGGAFRGLAKASFFPPGKPALRLGLQRKRGFAGYALDARPGESLRVLALRPGDGSALAAVPLRIPDSN
ncbi:hypothetical protein [Dokdonella sp.]|uniref:hypothetical protein n=1 Tax=Dokdonella sp. TaxID=2291710 RepID=UPI001B2E6EC7|nr:hypothetical protein [Dokdonella sp.]MBO9663264.1 hypothetical protein [Dokdonella sp.]